MNKKPENHFDVIVIGGGASGMMAAGRCAELKKKVLLIEKNRELGKKLKITGGGRCNITNAEYDTRLLLKNYGNGEQFLYSAFSQFGVKETFDYFEKRNLPLVIQARKRAFPETERAFDVFEVLKKDLKNEFVTIKSDLQVTKISKIDNKIINVQAGKEKFTANSYIIATGGNSHPETGSTGDGFRWLKDLGHSVKPPTPTIVPIAVEDAWVKGMPGISIPNMKITFYVDKEKKFAKTGKILFTHFGLSGPLILNSASKIADLLQEGIVTGKIDLYPDLDEAKLEKKILKVFDDNKNKTFKNVFSQMVPNGTAKTIISLLENIDLETKVHSVSRESRKSLIFTLKNLTFTVKGLMGLDRAVVADGGVDLAEIDTKTMRSKKIENLFVTGDLLHINRPSGGFSLQLCWTTGYIAGSHA